MPAALGWFKPKTILYPLLDDAKTNRILYILIAKYLCKCVFNFVERERVVITAVAYFTHK